MFKLRLNECQLSALFFALMIARDQGTPEVIAELLEESGVEEDVTVMSYAIAELLTAVLNQARPSVFPTSLNQTSDVRITIE